MGCLYSGCFRGILVVTSSLVLVGFMTEQSYNMAGSLSFSLLFLVRFGIWDQRSGGLFMSKYEQTITMFKGKNNVVDS